MTSVFCPVIDSEGLDFVEQLSLGSDVEMKDLAYALLTQHTKTGNEGVEYVIAQLSNSRTQGEVLKGVFPALTPDSADHHHVHSLEELRLIEAASKMFDGASAPVIERSCAQDGGIHVVAGSLARYLVKRKNAPDAAVTLFDKVLDATLTRILSHGTEDLTGINYPPRMLATIMSLAEKGSDVRLHGVYAEHASQITEVSKLLTDKRLVVEIQHQRTKLEIAFDKHPKSAEIRAARAVANAMGHASPSKPVSDDFVTVAAPGGLILG